MKKQEPGFIQRCKDRLDELEKTLFNSSFSSAVPPADLAAEGYRSCDRLLSFIALELDGFDFPGEGERLGFYKQTLTMAIGLKVFCRERYFMQLNMPMGTKGCINSYLDSQLAQLMHFEDRYGFFKGYFRSGMTSLDELYYLPDRGMEVVLLPEVVLPEKLELGCCSYLLARFKSNALLRHVLVCKLEGREQATDLASKQEKRPLTQTKVNLSVDQLGMGARAMLDSGVISGRSFQQICQDLAPRIFTPSKQALSPASIRSNAYTGEDVDKHTLIRMLEKMIRLIKEY